MKVVFLVAGKGRRLKELTQDNHKALITLDDKSLLHHLIENCIYAGLTDFIPIVGHCSDKILDEFNRKYSKDISVYHVKNEKYNETNNLYSLYCARELLEGEEFILCNADIIIDREIIKGISSMKEHSVIAIDDFDYDEPVDSPGILMNEDKISDLGRHISFENNTGYAIGVYKFNKELSKEFFKEAKKILDKDINAGFHDPLSNLFDKFDIFKYRTKECLWTDIDTYDDIEKARSIHSKIKQDYNKKQNAYYSDLKSKTVVVTGAGQGIGEAIARSFLENGSKVILISRSKIAWLKEYHPSKYIFLQKDIQEIEFFVQWLEEYELEKNKIDILINNAGVIGQSKLMDTTTEEWNEIININSKATFFLTQVFVKHMIKNNSGNIIFASSYATKLASFSYGIYAASKAMLLSLSKSLAAELAPYNIRVNSFSPGVIETKMTKKARENNGVEMLKDISLNRFGDTDEVAQAILFLASESSSYIHGIDLDISGGKFIIQNSNMAYKN